MTDTDTYGPIDFVLIEFPGTAVGGEVAEALLDVVERGIVALYDLLVIRKDADGSVAGFDIEDPTVGGLVTLAGARSGLLSDDDIAEAAAAMEPDTVAALLVYENTWARPFVAAARRQGGQMIASERLPAQSILDALDAAEAAD